MNRIDQKFKELKEKNKSAFIGFVTAGDPDYDTSLEVVKMMEEEGCDLIELGLPFSDPIADGPAIQAASLRAIENGMNTKRAMEFVKELRKEVKVPLLYLLYYNQVFKYGIDKFFKECEESGIDGLIIPDLAYEHKEECIKASEKYGVHIISLVTPVSEERKKMIAKDSKGFLYCVTSLGVTGERSSFQTDLKAFIEELSQYTDTPKALGFGISTPEQVREMKDYADGVIIGSALVRRIAEIAEGKLTMNDLRSFVNEVTSACHE